MKDREPRVCPPRSGGGAAHAGAADDARRILDQAADSVCRLSLALLDASIVMLRAPDSHALSAARHLAAVAARLGADAVRLPDCLTEVAALANAPARPSETSP